MNYNEQNAVGIAGELTKYVFIHPPTSIDGEKGENPLLQYVPLFRENFRPLITFRHGKKGRPDYAVWPMQLQAMEGRRGDKDGTTDQSLVAIMKHTATKSGNHRFKELKKRKRGRLFHQFLGRGNDENTLPEGVLLPLELQASVDQMALGKPAIKREEF